MKKTMFLTGSGGFIGKNLKEHFKEKYNIISPRSYEIDLTDKNAVENFIKKFEFDYIIHCASTGGARGVADRDTTLEDNLKMVENILKYKNDKTRVILFGSGAMYGKSRNLHKVKESDIGSYTPEDLYGKSKMLISELIKERKDTVCLNIFACFGYDEKETRFPTYAIKQNLNHLPIIINQNVIFDYLFIEDLFKIIDYFLLNQPRKNIINVTPTNSSKLSNIAEIINEISDFKSEIIFKTDALGNEYTGCNSRLLSEFPKMSFTPLKTGLKKLYEYIKKNHE